jgi:hypothetical protein
MAHARYGNLGVCKVKVCRSDLSPALLRVAALGGISLESHLATATGQLPRNDDAATSDRNRCEAAQAGWTRRLCSLRWSEPGTSPIVDIGGIAARSRAGAELSFGAPSSRPDSDR